MINPQILPNEEVSEAVDALMTDSDTATFWEATRTVLLRRPGWHLNVDEDQEFAWTFGWEGQGLFVVSVDREGIICYHHREDEEATVTTARGLLEWISLREDAEAEAGAADLLHMSKQIRDDRNKQLESDLPSE